MEPKVGSIASGVDVAFLEPLSLTLGIIAEGHCTSPIIHSIIMLFLHLISINPQSIQGYGPP